MPIQVGDVFGDYQVTGVLGRGGMGKVYRVRSLLTDREEAMKVVLPDLDDDPARAERFLREIRVHASLQHPNIATLHTALRIEGQLVMIMELVEGVSLEDIVRRGPMGSDDATHYMLQVLSALGYAHERGVIHRDIKPANILIAGGGTAKLTDFGIARSSGGVRLTGTGMAVGTLAYMSPEQVRSGEADSRSDIYSLGLTFYEAVTGRRAIQGPTEHAIMNAQLSEMPPDPAAVNPLVPSAVSAAIVRAVAKDPSQRYQSAREFADALRGHFPSDFVPTATVVSTQSQSTTELAEMETRLSRIIGPIARRLVADAARKYGSLSEIRQALAVNIEDAKERAAFLKTHATTAGSGAGTAPAALGAADVDRVAAALAGYIGPIAKVVVARVAKKARSVEQLREMAAAEIESPADRAKFLHGLRP